ncbi:hypothetical protein [Thermocrispum municipale]|jgi:hypothetical protein|uniref:hypothetical protein n=1 Tax=Thermocrispum municipale TaxID=37926 RepID=UPI0005BA566C|nr:hypothetical protein [Thermocrispum municipale]
MTMARRVAALLVALAAPAVLSACGGVDLAKVTYDRTTVPPQPGSGGTGPVPEGQVDVPELAVEKLRTIDTCELLKGEAVTQLGTPEEPRGSRPENCSVTVSDPAGKELHVSVRIGERVYDSRDRATGGLDGLPLWETRQEDACNETVLTDESAKIGISLLVTYADGEPCGAARKALAKIIQRSKSDPPHVQVPDGSLRATDPCSVVPRKLATSMLGQGYKTDATLLYNCTARSQDLDKGQIEVGFGFSYPPLESGESKRVKLTGSVRAIQRYYTPNVESCEIEWEHKKFSGPTARDGETVKVEFSNLGGKGDALDACRKAKQAAKAVLGELPGR